MKPMIWHPEESDTKVNQYLEGINHAPYLMIMAIVLGGICLFAAVISLTSF
jgi:hypothetical protein